MLPLFKKLLKDRRAIAGLVIGLVVTLVACAVLLAVGLLIHTNLGTSLEVVSAKTVNTTTAQNITYDVFNNVWSAYSLTSVVPLIAGAALVVGIIVAAFAIRSRR